MSDYKNKLLLNNGFHVAGPLPLDDRDVFSSIEELFIDKEGRTRDHLIAGDNLYNRVYPGMTVKVWVPAEEDKTIGGKGEYRLFTCIDNTPYLTNIESTGNEEDDPSVNAENFYIYWKEESKEVVDYVNEVVNTSVNAIETFLEDPGNITLDTSSALDLRTVNEEGFVQYRFAVVVDGETVGINSGDKLCSVEYELRKKDEANGDALISYEFCRKRPYETEFTPIAGADIDIQRDMVLKSVHLCKAKFQGGKYEETSFPTSPTWDTDEGDVYLHFIWNTKDRDASSPEDITYAETYLKVADVINLDLVEINTSIASLDASMYNLEYVVIPQLNQDIADFSTNINQRVEDLSTYVLDFQETTDGSLNRLNSSVNNLETFVQAENIKESYDGAIEISSKVGTTGSRGRTYEIGVKVDDDTIKIVKDQITGGKYRLEKLAVALNNSYASYQLAYQGPGEDDFTKLTDCTIDIPKDFVVKEVHLCKATESAGQYTETAKPTDSNWETAAGDVYLHFIWETKDPSQETSQTWLKVADVIKLDLSDINQHLADLDASIDNINKVSLPTINQEIITINRHLNDLDGSIAGIDASLYTIEKAVVPGLEQKISDVSSYVDASVSELRDYTDSSLGRLNTSVNNIESYVQSTIITNDSNGGTVVTPTAGTSGAKGQTYKVKANVDDDTIKIVNNIIKSGKYRLEKLDNPNEGAFASYQLAYQAPGATAYTKLTECSIDVPEDYVLKEVHLCKATYEDGVYKNEIYSTSTGFTEAAGDFYLHFIWQIQSSGEKTSETWLRVADVISGDLQDVYRRLDILDASYVFLYDAALESEMVCATAVTELAQKLYDVSTEVLENRTSIAANVNSIEATNEEVSALNGRLVELSALVDSLNEQLNPTPEPEPEPDDPSVDGPADEEEEDVSTNMVGEQEPVIKVDKIKTMVAETPQVIETSLVAGRLDVTELFTTEVGMRVNISLEMLKYADLYAVVDGRWVRCNACPILSEENKYAVYFEYFKKASSFDRDNLSLYSVMFEEIDENTVKIVKKK